MEYVLTIPVGVEAKLPLRLDHRGRYLKVEVDGVRRGVLSSERATCE
jgi:hypothetical protein